MSRISCKEIILTEILKKQLSTNKSFQEETNSLGSPWGIPIAGKAKIQVGKNPICQMQQSFWRDDPEDLCLSIKRFYGGKVRRGARIKMRKKKKEMPR